MIKKINRLKDFGIYKDFKAENLDEFLKVNILYGWNYSGKTTLSRLFRGIEEKRINLDYENCEFEIELEDGSKINKKNIEQTSLSIRVFNADFIKENLDWDNHIEPILMLGKENIKLQKKLIIKNKLEKRVHKFIKNLNEKKSNIETELNSNISQKASNIKKELSIPDFNKLKLEKYIDDNYSNHILEESELNSLKIAYYSTEEKEILDYYNLDEINIDKYKIKNLLEKIITRDTIEKLEKNSVLENWVKTGMEINSDKKNCEFCGGFLTSDLFEMYNKHFSDSYNKFINELEEEIIRLKNKKLKIIFFDKERFYKNLQDEYISTKEIVVKQIEIFNEIIFNLISQLEYKKSSITKEIKLFEYTMPDFKSNIDKLNELIATHNHIAQDYENQKKKNKEKLISHLVSEFVYSLKYFETKESINSLTEKIITINSNWIPRIRTTKESIEKEISEEAKGAEVVNDYLRSFFSKDDIVLKMNKNKKYKLFRKGIEVKNLSEGEKTAISLAYFISKLNDKSTDINNTIVYIDDPISSLDSNHIFNVYSLLNIELKKAKQLFISTHNFDFFKLIKGIEKNKKENLKIRYFLIKRLSNKINDQSQIETLPKIMELDSEYHYLFSELYKFNLNPTEDFDLLYNLPNMARRILEIYTSFKIPNGSNLNERIKKIADQCSYCEIKKNRLYKYINHYSHSNSVEGNLGFPELQECKIVISSLLDLIKKTDNLHYEILEKKSII